MRSQLRYLSRLLFLAFLVLVPVVALTVSVSATPTNPNSITIGEIAVFRDLWATGDQLIFMRYNLQYSPITSAPTVNAGDSFQMAVYDTDGTTIGPTRKLNYYLHNIISIYMTPAQVTTTYGYTWGDALQVKCMGMPSIFTLVEGTNMRTTTLVAGDYKSTSDFSAYILSQAAILEASWGIDWLDAAGKLNTTGGTYFTEAIPGLQALLPGIFMTTSETPVVSRGNFTMAYVGTLAGHASTRLANAFTGIGGFFGTTGNWFAFYVLILICGVVASGLFAATKHPGVGLVMAVPLLAAWAWLGLGSQMLILLAVVALVVALLFGVVFILGRFTS